MKFNAITLLDIEDLLTAQKLPTNEESEKEQSDEVSSKEIYQESEPPMSSMNDEEDETDPRSIDVSYSFINCSRNHL